MRAKVTTETRPNPASRSVAAHATAVAPVVRTSSTRITPTRLLTEPQTWNASLTFSLRARRASLACRRPPGRRSSMFAHRQSRWRPSNSASSAAWLNPRSRWRAGVSGTGMRRGVPSLRSKRVTVAERMLRPMGSASARHRPYLSALTRRAAVPSNAKGAVAFRRATGHSAHPVQLIHVAPVRPGSSAAASAVTGQLLGSPHREQRGAGTLGIRCQHNAHTGG